MRDSEIEPGYLSHERLSPEEIASIETALRSATPIRARRRPVRWLGLAAAAAMVATAVFVVTQFPSQPIDNAPVPIAVVDGPRAMVLEIQRTDLADSKPYTLIIQLETAAPAVDSEVQP